MGREVKYDDKELAEYAKHTRRPAYERRVPADEPEPEPTEQDDDV